MDLRNLTKAQIVNKINSIVPIANSKLKKIYSKNLQNYNQSFIKKYNMLTNNTVNPDLVTKKGYFRKGGIKQFRKSQLIRRYETIKEFIENDYASAEYTERHLASMRERLGLNDDEVIKKIFDLYREYGYENYGDSEVITYMANIVDKYSDFEGGSMEALESLESILQSIEDDMNTNIMLNQEVTVNDYIKALKENTTILE